VLKIKYFALLCYLDIYIQVLINQKLPRIQQDQIASLGQSVAGKGKTHSNLAWNSYSY